MSMSVGSAEKCDTALSGGGRRISNYGATDATSVARDTPHSATTTTTPGKPSLSALPSVGDISCGTVVVLDDEHQQGHYNDEDEEQVPDCAKDGITTCQMLAHVAQITLPTLVGLVFMFATQAITMSFVGQRLGFQLLAQFSVGLSIFNILGASLGIGFCGALDTLAPQAFGRNPRSTELGILVQRAVLVNCLLFLPIVVFYFYGAEYLLDLIYPPMLASGALIFLKSSPLYLLSVWMASIFNRVYPAQHLAMVPLYANIVSAAVALYAGNKYLNIASTTEQHGSSPAARGGEDIGMVPSSLSVVSSAGIPEAVFVLTLTSLAGNVVNLVAMFFHPQSVLGLAPFPSREAFNAEGLRAYLRLGTSSLVATCSEWWTYEAVQVICAQIGAAEVASFTILLNILMLFFSVAFAIGISGATLVGNCLGANRPMMATKYMRLCFQVGAVASAVTGGILCFGGLQVVGVYTQSREVLDTVKPVMYLFALWHIFDNAKSCLAGVYRGCGFQDRAAKRSLMCLWGIGLTLTVILTLTPYQYGLTGVLVAQLIGLGVLVPFMLYDCLWGWDFKVLAHKASLQQQQNEEQAELVEEEMKIKQAPKEEW